MGGEARADIYRLSSWVPMGYVSVDPNLWGLSKHAGRGDLVSGHASISSVGGPLLFRAQLDLSRLNMPQTEVVAYHEVIFGYKPWGVPENHPIIQRPLRLPVRVGEMPELTLHTEHRLERSNTGINISYDIWLLRGGLRPPAPGDYEVMVWLYRRGVNPAGSKVAETTTRALVDNTTRHLAWEVWYMPSVGWGGWGYVAFVLRETMPSGSIAVNLKEIMDKTAETLNLDIKDHYMVGLEFGSEVFYSEHIDVEWRLNRYVVSAVTAPKCSRD